MERPVRKLWTVLLVLLLFSIVAVPVHAADPVVYGFEGITNNNAGDTTIGENQLTVTVSEAGVDQVKFTLANSGPAQSAIAEVYFFDGTLFGVAAIENDPNNVVFSEGASPPVCPGYDLEPATAFFTAEANPPPPFRGVNPGETLGITFELLPGVGFDSVVSDLDNGDLRICIHVISFASGGSESFVNKTPPGDETAITLASFTASASGSGVALDWETAAEIDNAGFNLLRATSAGGPYIQVNSQILGARGNGTGASYSYLDSPGEGTFYYQLEDVDFDGVSTLHVPVTVTVGPEGAASLLQRLFLPLINQ